MSLGFELDFLRMGGIVEELLDTVEVLLAVVVVHDGPALPLVEVGKVVEVAEAVTGSFSSLKTCSMSKGSMSWSSPSNFTHESDSSLLNGGGFVVRDVPNEAFRIIAF